MPAGVHYLPFLHDVLDPLAIEQAGGEQLLEVLGDFHHRFT
jgi:hypothetical protein